MICANLEDCYKEIDDYCGGSETGHVLLVNAQRYEDFHSLLNRCLADSSKKCVFVSDHCPENGLPNLDDVCLRVTGEGNYVLAGISQAAMLQSDGRLRELIGKLLGLPVSGHAVVLLDHSAHCIKDYMSKDPRVDRKVVLLEKGAPVSALPRIRIVRTEADCLGAEPIQNMKGLLAYLERMSVSQNEERPELTVIAPFSRTPFSESLYSLSVCDNIYNSIAKKYPDVAAGTEESYGTEEQWRALAPMLDECGSLSAVANREFGAGSDYSLLIRDVWSSGDFRAWLLWLSMKVGGAGNGYISYAVKNSTSAADFEKHIYNDLLEIEVNDRRFDRYYAERKSVIKDMPERIRFKHISSYCDRVRHREKQAVYYLTDISKEEKLELMTCLSIYDYSEEELSDVAKRNFNPLYLYLRPFRFTEANIKLAEKDEALRNEFTDYFREYKLQKITNRIQPDFLSKVEAYAATRPYNKVPARSFIVNTMPADIKDKAQPFFFDALGVEYLSFISAKCKEYGMIAELSVGRCDLPSITELNKEFTKFFTPETKKIDDLDELKHHSQNIDYTRCKMPVYLFSELEIIDDQLKKIQSLLGQGEFEYAVVIADHGASRLAVIHEEENSSALSLDEKGEHSGRCCPANVDPHIPFATYENGFAVLANYSRFKGGRKANVEVHGGAALEEVLVPVITISRKPEKLEISFAKSIIELRGKEVANITLLSNMPLKEPRLLVNGNFYDGIAVGDDKRRAKFEMPKLKRSGSYTADVYDGNALLVSRLTFTVQKSVAKEKEDFKF